MVSFKSAVSVLLLAGSASAFTVPQKHQIGGPVVSVAPSPQPRSTSCLYMGWGPDPIWAPSEIQSIQLGNMSKTCSKVTVSIPEDTAGAFAIPGQYVQVRAGEESKPLFLAIASAPDAETPSFEFLIKKTEGNTWISERDEMAENIEISQVLGSGFDFAEGLDSITTFDFPCQNVLLFAAGSGIAPIASAIESGLLKTQGVEGGSRTARLYYGERTETDLCYVDRFPAWEQAGVEVVPVLSQPSESWGGRTGYVQNALEEDGVPIPRNTGALLCGMKGMTEAVTDTLTKAGVFDGRILQNF